MSSYLSGTLAQPVYVRQYPGERATINSGLVVAGNYVWYWGFEVANLNWPWPRYTSTSGSFPGGKPADGVAFTQGSVGCKLINVVVRDSADGVADQQESSATEIYGTLTYNNGWSAPDRGHGHGLYIQNASSIPKLLTNNITYNSFDIGIQAYGAAGPVAHIHLDGNVAFNAGLPDGKRVDNVIFAAGGVKQDIKIANSVFYNPLDAAADNTGFNEMDALWASGMNLDLDIRGSFWVGATPTTHTTLLLRNWQSVLFQGNTVVGPLDVQGITTYNWSGNTYYKSAPPPGIDQASAVFNHNPTGVTTLVQPNRYEPGRAHIIVMNWDKTPTVSVDVTSSGLTAGTQYEVRDSQNFYGDPILTGTYDGNPITLPMVLTQVAPVVGAASTPPHTSAEFNAFILAPKGTLPPVPPPPGSQPAISLNKSSLTFNGINGGAAPSGQSLTVTNSGPSGAVLNWYAVGSQPWLSTLPLSGQLAGGASSAFTVSVSTAGLAVGTYNGTLTVTDPYASNNPQTVNVSLTVSLPPPPSGQSYLINMFPGTVRNDFTGFVGMRLAVGPTAMTVSSLGRLMSTGNTDTHTLKLVNAATGADVPGGAVAVSMAGKTPGTFVYGVLATPVILAANGAYYVGSQEASGKDRWYDLNTTVLTTSDATVTSAAWADATWHTLGGNGNAYVPVNFGYTLGGTEPPPPPPPPPPSGLQLITGTTAGSSRNDFTGWVGLRLAVGQAPLTVSGLGRLMVQGNSRTHVVKLVNAATGVDVPGGSVSVSMLGGTPGSFVYAALASPVVLTANSAYYLATQETANQDTWYDANTIVQTTADASVTQAVYFDSSWHLMGSANRAYGPPNLTYAPGGTTPPPPPPPPPPGGTAFITGQSLSGPRRDFSGWVGMQLRVAASAVSVTALGRIVTPGDSASHVVKLVNASTGLDVPGGSATVPTASATAGSLSYATLTAAVTLAPNTTYYLVTQEVSAGDGWYDLSTTVQTTNVATVLSAVYGVGSAYIPTGSSGHTYGPVGFLYQQGGTTPPGTGANAASFIKIDSTTGGTWKGVYGADGQAIAGGLPLYPTYAQVAIGGGAQTWTWASSTPDLRALQKSSNPNDRIASVWYSATVFTINLNLTDGNTHQVALYAMDWDNGSRSQRVEVLDAVSQSVLDSRTLSNFSQGQYMVWNIQGSVILRVTRLAGANAVINGIFFGGN
ncbi:MAG: hypothetical protein ABI759_05950 [Candidatus Solibacter sp.]